MKLAFLIHDYFPHGGQQRDFLNIARECLSRGHAVSAYVLSWQGDAPEGLRRVRVPVRGPGRLGRRRRYTGWMRRELAAARPSLVVGFGKMPLLDVYFAADVCFAARAARRGPCHRLTPRSRHLMRCEAAVFGDGSATRALMLSPRQRRDYLRHYPGCAPRLHDLPPGLGEDRRAGGRDPAARAAMRAELGLRDGELLLLQVGSGFRVKGVDRALRAVAALPPALRERTRYLLVGRGRPGPFLRLARRLGIGARASASPGRSDVPRLLAAADLLLHPAYAESAGHVLLEATAAGLPVLTTAACGYAFHIERARSGRVCGEPFSQRELDGRLRSMLEALPSAPWSANGLAYGRRVDLHAMPRAAVDLLERFAGEAR